MTFHCPFDTVDPRANKITTTKSENWLGFIGLRTTGELEKVRGELVENANATGEILAYPMLLKRHPNSVGVEVNE